LLNRELPRPDSELRPLSDTRRAPRCNKRRQMSGALLHPLMS
jgi:hypothetical protein